MSSISSKSMNNSKNFQEPSFAYSFLFVCILSAVMVFVAYEILSLGRFYGLLVLASSLIPILAVKIAGLQLKRIVPDVIFGAIDTGLLTVAALVGASFFGIVGAIVGGVIGDAVTDGIAGFFEGGIAEWLRSLGIDESRTAIGSCCGKMVGCLLGSGMVLLLASILGISSQIHI